MTLRISRSHQEDYRECPRKAYLRYWHDGTGLTKVGIKVELSTGILTHNIFGRTLEPFINQALPVFPGAALKDALNRSLRQYFNEMDEIIDEVVNRKLALEIELSRDELETQTIQQAALAEAMVRAWYMTRYPWYRDNFKLISVEKETKTRIGPGEFMQRKDLRWEHIDWGKKHVLELKTTGWTCDDASLAAWRYDHQVLTHFFGEDNLDSVLLELLFKGRKYDGLPTTPLIKGYKCELIGDDALSPTETQYQAKYTKRKGWSSFFIYEHQPFIDAAKKNGMTVVEYWMRNYLDFQVLDDHCFHTEIQREPEELEEWKQQTARELSDIGDALVQIDGHPEDKVHLLNLHFPALKSRSRCTPFNGKIPCSFLSICHRSHPYHIEADRAVLSGGFKQRVPHHVGEFDD